MSRKGVVQIEVTCALDAEDCKPWDELTPAQQEEQAATGPGCDGTGEFCGLCIVCDFCLDWEVLDAYPIDAPLFADVAVMEGI